MNDTAIAFLDIETSGLDPVIHEPIEVAYILEPEGKVINVSLDFNVKGADPEALKVNGYGHREFAPQVESNSIFAGLLVKDLKDRIIIGNNVQFDMNFLREFLRRHDLAPTWRHSVVDLKAIAGGVLGIEPPWHIDTLCEKLGATPPGLEQHTALGDTIWNREFYQACYRFAKRGEGFATT